ncbi:anti-sigma factor [Piscinibacter sakaiensis]|uniref:anti-sigma factor domain-containing protein n=1 Tax=Piscinibacter sakaiensis TaxID=1547922 RepID=UPI003729BA0D
MTHWSDSPQRLQQLAAAYVLGTLADTPRWRRWLDALLAPAPAFALAAGLFAGLLLPGLLPMLGDPEARTELPESYVGVLATTDGRPGLIVSSRRLGRVVDVKRVAEQPVPPGLTLYLWTIDAQGRPAPVAPLAAGPFVRLTIPQPAEAVFAQAVELGVTAEPLGQAPAQPSGAWLYRGLCGKLWRVPAPR